ncbi:MAG: C4-dicarboxylate transporter DcuC [Gemmataceae bacterium]
MILLLSLLIILLAIVAITRRQDARLVLLVAGFGLGLVAGNPGAILRMFFATLSNEQFVLPICCAVGFGYMLRHTGCDQHLVQLLVKPLRHIQFLLIPGTVLIGFMVNTPVISQVGTAVVIGPVLMPLLRKARISALTSAAALLLGASLGGDLLNPGAPEWRSVSQALKKIDDYKDFDLRECTQRVVPLLLVQVGVATSLFWFMSLLYEKKQRSEEAKQQADRANGDGEEIQFHVNLLKAAVPLVPLAVLFLTGPPLNLFHVPKEWLTQGESTAYESRLIGAAMLLGTAAAALVSWQSAKESAKVFFEGAGFGFTHIISVIVAAQCFGEGIKLIGLGEILRDVVADHPSWLLPIAGLLPVCFAMLSGTGFGATQSLYEFFVQPAIAVGINPVQVGAVVAITASAGRTMSPVAAITLHCSSLIGVTPFALVRRVAIPLLAATAATVGVAMLMGRI